MVLSHLRMNSKIYFITEGVEEGELRRRFTYIKMCMINLGIEINNYMIDNNFEPDDIKESFRGDKEIATALKYYADQLTDEEEYEEFPEDNEDEY